MRTNTMLSLLFMLAVATVNAQDLVKKTVIKTSAEDMNNKPMACLLTDAELAERKSTLQKEIFSKVKKAEEVSDGYQFYFDDKDSLLSDLFSYILAEKKCCPFFQQDIAIGSDSSGIIWKISGEEGIKEMLIETLGSVAFPNK